MSKEVIIEDINSKIKGAKDANSITPNILGDILIDTVNEIGEGGGGSGGLNIFTYTTSGDGVNPIFLVPHNLGYTPTMVMVTGNTKDAVTNDYYQSNYDYVFYANATSTHIVITYNYHEYYGGAPNEGVNNLKWTIICK